MIKLGINIDHIATIRNARREIHPNIYLAAKYAYRCGADSITIHLREDRRHINDNDLRMISSYKKIPLNLEIAANNEMVKIALKNNPNFICIVPENRNEITTEGGLNLKKQKKKIKKIISTFNKKKIRTSLFIDPKISDIKISKDINTDCIELHTGKISNKIKLKKNFKNELRQIARCAKYAKSLGIEVHAGHGMDYKTAEILSRIKEIKEFNIGHFIIGESIFFGLKKVINNFKKILK
tara:strand:- start:449 stop:1165 length:717 start_codon:yes stop_codon:yes gene_type:complete